MVPKLFTPKINIFKLSGYFFLLLSSKTKKTDLFQTSPVIAKRYRGHKDTGFYNANSHRRLKSISVSSSFFFIMADTSQRWGGVCVCGQREWRLFLFLQSADSEVGTTSTPLSLPPHKAFLSVWCLCQFLSVSLSFSNLIIPLWTLSCKGLTLLAEQAGRRGVTQRVGLGCVGGVTNASWLVISLV